MKKLNNKGLTPMIVAVIIVAVAGIGIAGYRVYQNSKDSQNTEQTQSAQPDSTKEESKTPEAELVSYDNKDVGIKFQYPKSWVINEDLSNFRGSGVEGEIVLTSPEGLRLRISPNYGGKGGDCEKDPSDVPHNTKNCSTVETLSKEKINTTANATNDDYFGQDVYLITTKYTYGKEGLLTGTYYNAYLTNYKIDFGSVAPQVGAYRDYGSIAQTNDIDVDTHLLSDKLKDQSYLDSDEVKTALDILRSVQLY